MRRFVILSGLVLLAACGSKEPAASDATPAADAVSEAAAEDTDAAAPSIVGNYEEKGPDGKMVATAIKADGTYTESTDGKVTESGKWSQKDGKDCFDPDGDKDPTRCFTTSTMAADGTFTATNEKGETITVKKVS